MKTHKQNFKLILKKGYMQFSYFLKIKQPEIRPIGNITGPSSMFLPQPILGGWRLDQLSYRGYLKLIAFILCTL
jgi:hypothetical protein